MSTPTELWNKWEGRLVDKKFLLRQWLGGSDHSAVFLTQRTGREPQKAVIKLIPVESPDQENLEADAQLARWAAAAELSHPHLIPLFECGRCQIDHTRLLYVVMEYADENLAEVLPLRPLSPAEASEMLRPAAEVLAYLHRLGFAHGRIKPSNIMAVDNQLKISADGLRKTGERAGAPAPTIYDAPEVATAGLSSAADIWSLAITLLAVLTQNESSLKNADQGLVAVPETIPQPLHGILRQSLQIAPRQRCTAADILTLLQPQALQTPTPMGAQTDEAHTRQERPKRWVVVAIVVVALLLVAWVGSRFLVHQPPIPAAETQPASQPSAQVPATQSPAPFSRKEKPPQTRVVRGSVLQQVLPDVSRGAQSTITGRVKVSIQVSVDASGHVAEAKLVSPEKSKYFATRALAAARQWKFNPPQVDGQATSSEWFLRFQFGSKSTQVFPAEVRP